MEPLTRDDLKKVFDELDGYKLNTSRMLMDEGTAIDLGILEAEMCDRCLYDHAKCRVHSEEECNDNILRRVHNS